MVWYKNLSWFMGYEVKAFSLGLQALMLLRI
jgi:hypothetical protein